MCQRMERTKEKSVDCEAAEAEGEARRRGVCVKGNTDVELASTDAVTWSK